jgi:hypothetical protein
LIVQDLQWESPELGRSSVETRQPIRLTNDL